MLNSKKIFRDKLLILSTLVGVGFFLFFGFYHLTQFETSDEHLWRDKRIPAYWEGIKNGFQKGDWSKTYINDKPGVSLALVSGVGVPFLREPDLKDWSKKEKESAGRYKIYDTTITEHNNFVLRVPLLLFLGLVIFPLLTYLVFKVTKSREVASLFVVLLGLNPIIIGIGRILNPDTILWGVTMAAFLSFVLFLKGEKGYGWRTGVLTGLALVSKYTGNLLFLFYLIFGLLYFLYKQDLKVNEYWRRFLGGYWKIVAISWSIFAVLVPAVLQTPYFFSYLKPKFFARGTYFSPAIKPVIIPLIFFFVILAGDTFYANSFLLKRIKKIFQQRGVFYLSRLLSLALLLLFGFVLVNAWSGARFFPLDDLKEIIGSTRKLHFDFLTGGFSLFVYFKKLSLQAVNFIFALPEFIVITVMLLWVLVLKDVKKILWLDLVTFISLLPFIFFIGGLKAKVFVNVRYAIILFPFFILLTSLALVNFWQYFKVRERLGRKALWIGGLAVVIMIGWQIGGILNIRPYYFNYQNIFLPKEYVLTDSWGYGMFEAAMKLNSLPGAEDLVVWSDRGAFCHYFVGHCVKNRRMDRSKIVPDFFVVTRRNVARKRFFDWRNDSGKFAKHLPEYYYQGDVFEKPWWELDIDGRKKNYIKIIKAEEK